MMCPSCRQDEAETVEVPCLDDDGELMRFSVCRNCDYGINDHTEGECDCAPICEAFNVVREGMCKRTLTPLGDCPDALDHGDEFSV